MQKYNLSLKFTNILMEKLLSYSLYLLFNSYVIYLFASPLRSIFTIISQHAFDKENSVKNSDKNLSGKSDEREVKLCKNKELLPPS